MRLSGSLKGLAPPYSSLPSSACQVNIFIYLKSSTLTLCWAFTSTLTSLAKKHKRCSGRAPTESCALPYDQTTHAFKQSSLLSKLGGENAG